MPSTESTTLQRIQREISDVIEREKELRSLHTQNGTNNNDEHEANNNIKEVQHVAKPVLYHSKSTPAGNGIQNNLNGTRLFTPSPATKGVMHKFIKSRGKLTTVSGFQGKPIEIQQQQTWSIPDVMEPPKVTEPGKLLRKGFVPIEVRMKQEFEDLHYREMELRSDRRRSQGDILDSDEFDDSDVPHLGTTLRPAKSMAQLYNSDEYNNEFRSISPRLKPALSLAELCDASDDEIELPGSHSLIMQWEEMIQKNQQDHS